MLDWMRELPSLSPADAETPVLDKIKELQWHMGNVMNALRLAVVGECKGPHMFEITELLGFPEVERRVRAAIENIKPQE